VNGDFKATAIGIGINPPSSTDSYKLFVDGGIAAREVKVTIQNFPDYVFNGNYPLIPIYRLEQYVFKEKHLPGIPSSEDIKKNDGVELGIMQSKLLEKVEEQTLYIISLQKQIDELRIELKKKEDK
jgi:hypothetical protein